MVGFRARRVRHSDRIGVGSEHDHRDQHQRSYFDPRSRDADSEGVFEVLRMVSLLDSCLLERDIEFLQLSCSCLSAFANVSTLVGLLLLSP